MINLKEIDTLLDSCEEQNKILKLGGVLLYSEGNFFQILEGDKAVVLNLFERIKEDPRHDGIVQVMGQDIESGSVEGYVVDMVDKVLKHQSELPEKYVKTLEGLPQRVKTPLENMMRTFIANS